MKKSKKVLTHRHTARQPEPEVFASGSFSTLKWYLPRKDAADLTVGFRLTVGMRGGRIEKKRKGEHTMGWKNQVIYQLKGNAQAPYGGGVPIFE